MLKCTKFTFRLGSAAGACSTPQRLQTLTGFKGPTSKGRDEEGRGRQGKGEEWREEVEGGIWPTQKF